MNELEAIVRELAESPVTGPDDWDALVSQAGQAVADARVELHRAVRAAIDNGRTWAEIGAQLGITKQAAWERFHNCSPEPN